MIKKYFLGLMITVVLIGSINLRAEPISGSIKLSSTFFPVSTVLQGDIGISANTISINPAAIIGLPYITLVSELLTPGTYTRVYNLSIGGSITRTGVIPAGTIGAYFVISSNATEHQLFMAWDVSNDGEIFANHPIAGNVWIGSPYDGRTLSYSFNVIPPFSEVTMQIIGGGNFECSEQSGSTITLDSNTTTGGIAVLDRIEWTIDNVLVNQGSSFTEFYSLGSHIVVATAITTTGDTASDTVNIDINDTVSPVLQVEFFDIGGSQVTTAVDGDYTVQYNNTDICDSSPVVTGTAKPVMAVESGDIISISASSGDVVLPTTAVEVSASSTDASGNSTTDTKVLFIQ